MIDILIAVASKHGATWEVGKHLAQLWGEAGHNVQLSAPDEVTSLEPGTAVVLGSGIYAGSWLRPTAAFVDRFAGQLRDHQVFAFSCGPVGNPPGPTERPAAADKTAAKAGAADNRVFGGVVARATLSLPERAIIRMLKVPDGDYRDWDQVTAWAHEVSAALQPA